MGGLIADMALVCCCSCCGQVGVACKAYLGPQKVVKLFYIMLIIAFLLPVFLLPYLLNELSGWIKLTPTQVTARMSVTLLCFFALMLMLMLCRNRISQIINEGLFIAKFILLLGLFIGSLFVNQNFFRGYSVVARYLSIIYVVLQTIILIDLFYLAGIKLFKRYNDGEIAIAGVLIGLSMIFEGLAIFLNLLAYINFSADACGSTLWLSILTSCMFIVLIAVQLLKLNQQNSLLTTSLVSLLISYLSYSAQLSFGQGCKARLTASSFWVDVATCLCLFIMTTYGSIMGGLTEQPSLQNVAEKDIEGANEKLYSEGWSWVKWHFFMCLASIYLSMIVSNWQSTQETTINLEGNSFAFWIRATLSMVTSLLYIWTMIAPSVFPERDFVIE